MKVDIGKAISLVLEERHVASLPGLGTFRVNVKPAHLSDSGQDIQPPSAELVFDEQSINDHSLVEFISEYHNISKVKALKVLEAFESKVTNGLKSKGKVRVTRLGLFEKNADNTIKFKPVKSISESIFYGLKSVPLSVAHTTEVEGTVETAQIEEKTVITEDPIEAKSEKQTLTQVKKETLMADYNDPNYEDNHGYNSDYDGPSKWSYLLRPLLILLGFILLSAFLFKKCASWSLKNDSIAVVDEFKEDDKTETEDTKEIGQDSNTDDTKSDDTDNTNSDGVTIADNAKPRFTAADGAEVYNYSDIAGQPLNCIIITGTFNSSHNILRMIKKLEAEGYDSYTEQTKNGATRVGFFFQCKEEDLEKYIYDIRQRVSGDAWYLSPRIHVD